MERSKCELEMLSDLGIDSIEALFADVPKEVRTGMLGLEQGMSEQDLTRTLAEVLSENRTAAEWPSFLGAGVYRHFIPAAVRSIVSRSEFITSYTPYQPEVSQGMLQALFEYQSYMSELTGMDVVNCSMYDASTALGEAVLMSHRISGGSRFLVSRAANPQRVQVARLYASGANISIQEVDFDDATGLVDLEDLRSKMGDDVSGFYFETPNFLGPIETQWEEVRRIVGKRTMVVGANPLALALIKPPGEMGADIAIGDAQVFGVPVSLGGPTVGVFGCKSEHVRKMPGRLIGMTADTDGRRAFCMTLQTREQHIRRSKATSNICSNEALLAVAAAAHLAVVGRSGLRRTAAKNIENMRSLSARIDAIDGFNSPVFDATHFNEFVVRSERPALDVHRALLARGIHGGYPLGSAYPELGECTLYATTEMHTKRDHDMLVSALEGME